MSLLSDCKIILCKASPIKTKEASLKCGLGTLQVWVRERGERGVYSFLVLWGYKTSQQVTTTGPASWGPDRTSHV